MTVRCNLLRTAARAALVAVLGAPALHASAQDAQPGRSFPATALRGTLEVLEPPAARLDDRDVRLAPGARIRGANNLLLLSSQLVGQAVLVHYTVEPASGLLKDVWVLTPEEAARRPWPTTPEQAQRWQFDAQAQRWSR